MGFRTHPFERPDWCGMLGEGPDNGKPKASLFLAGFQPPPRAEKEPDRPGRVPVRSVQVAAGTSTMAETVSSGCCLDSHYQKEEL